MAIGFEEIDFQQTPMGDLILRRRNVLSLGNKEVYEVILGDAFLMSSLFTVVEEALAELGLAAIDEVAEGLQVVVGGLGLGHTAQAALRDERVEELIVVDTMSEVIGWHEQGLVPLGDELITQALEEALCQSPVGATVASVFSDDAVLHEFSCLMSDPGSQRQVIHPDTPYIEGKGPVLYTCFIALQDVTMDMGPTVWLPRTHTKF